MLEISFVFLADEASPGNYGIYDQNMAMRWVKDNIEGEGVRISYDGSSKQILLKMLLV